jgi:protein-S-isoprenylcysteine O-methyltransferase Ste14
MIVIWFVPIMTLNWLTFCMGSSLYFWIGSYFEEKKMVREFGDSYLPYQKKTPRFFPFIKI